MRDRTDEPRDDEGNERGPEPKKVAPRRAARARDAKAREERRLERLAKQRLRQAQLRAHKAAERIPDRDDVARAMLHFAFSELLRPGRVGILKGITRVLVAKLTSQGFAEAHAKRVIDDLLDRYEDGWDFQRKARLLSVRDDEGHN